MRKSGGGTGRLHMLLFAGVTALIATGYAIAEDGGGSGGGGGTSSGGNLGSLKKVGVPGPNLGQFVANRTALVQLGKALFWDMQAGGDGQQACASCHFNAGANNRTRGTLNPHGSANFSANTDVTAAMFPITTSLVYGGAGVRSANFTGLDFSGTNAFSGDLNSSVADSVFTFNGHNARQVTGRRPPSVINAVYNYRNFWDGRALASFNGVNPFGSSTAAGDARVLRVTNGTPALTTVSLDLSSAASQAVGPANNPVEMSYNGRSFLQLGKKLLNPAVKPLRNQMVATNDSLLGPLSNGALPGLNVKYADLVKAAFQPQWWNSTACVNADKAPISCSAPDAYSVMEANFSLFWGLSIQAYESTLIANESPFDNNTLNAQQVRGQRVYTNEGRCVSCHSGPELTKASVREVTSKLPINPSTGFFNTGVRPVAEDGGLSNGSFKTPHLRNVELTGPYFHNGGMATLRQVVDFYDRGGDFPSKFTDSQVRPLGLTEQQKTDLVAFMLALTDPRVKNESAPFDHPSLRINNGLNADGSDAVQTLPAVGAGGRAVEGKPPLTTFLGLSPFDR